MLDRAHFLSSLSIIEFFKTVEIEHLSSSNSAQVFGVLARVIQVFQDFFRDRAELSLSFES